MTATLIHISDIHANEGRHADQVADDIVTAVQQGKFMPGFLVVSGDLSFKGAGAQAAGKLISVVAKKLSIPREKIVCCPGNHDLKRVNKPTGIESHFQEYFATAEDFLADADRALPEPCKLYHIEGVDFLVLNSVYHLDWTFGKVDLYNLQKQIDKLTPNSIRVAVVHHHVIGLDEQDKSQIVNAYPFLKLLVDHEFDALLHGHRHIAMSLTIGRCMKVIGVGTVKFPPEPNINNQFNVVEVGKRVVRFRFLRDSMSSGAGSWNVEEENW